MARSTITLQQISEASAFYQQRIGRVTVEAVCIYLGCSETTIYRILDGRNISHV